MSADRTASVSCRDCGAAFTADGEGSLRLALDWSEAHDCAAEIKAAVRAALPDLLGDDFLAEAKRAAARATSDGDVVADWAAERVARLAADAIDVDKVLAAVGAYIREHRTPPEKVGTAVPSYSGERKAFREGYEVAMGGMLHILRQPRTVEEPAA